MRYTLSLNADQGVVSKIVTVLSAPIFIIATSLFRPRINADPNKDWAVPITAPVLKVPVTARSMRYGKEGEFDQGTDPARDALADPGDDKKLNDDSLGGAYNAGGQGTAQTEAALRYEHQARLKRQAREAGHQGRTMSDEDQRAAVRRMLDENPNATDHSTILTNPAHAEQVLAYDVAIGWVNPSKITPTDMLAFRQFANWMTLEEAKEALPIANDFLDYWAEGFYAKKQLQHTYTMQHMKTNAPGIVDDRERSLLGRIKG